MTDDLTDRADTRGAAREITDPVTVSDNGVRNIAPPTFCFELRDGTGTLVDVVSRVVLGDLRDFDAVAALPPDRPAALGLVAEYDAGPQARTPGRQFTIRQD
ncbi:hypothetical protein [Nocardia blacklockiae]|uniref:hypothetical protein n=1 Tax=Nocardia blacklockiae TaxID=480036 RepID=UPI001894AC32|nr:hypothetical protein [Nocardia blacklockiae]MBF6176475.1 hypothetical protein [Nocardia blacklockiae]